ncbi:MAG: hypothetical protein ACT4O4_04010, partial [Nitrospiraceae bacterium]
GTTPATARDLDIDVVVLKSPVSAGETAELVIQSETGAMCLGSAWPESQPPQRAQLSGKTVHRKGQAAWAWQIPKAGAAENWKIDLQCATSEKKGRLSLSFEVR